MGADASVEALTQKLSEMVQRGIKLIVAKKYAKFACRQKVHTV